VLTRYGDRKPLVVAQPICSSTGIKLLDAGAHVDTRVFERLFSHKLAAPIDQSVSTAESVRARGLPAAALARIAALPGLDRCTSQEPLRRRVAAALAACPLSPAIATRLTVARSEAPALFDHLLRAAYLACYLGAAAQLATRELEVLAAAALLHDIGMLHADPALFDADRPLAPAARRHLHAHPLIGEMVARSDPALSPAVAEAIAQHHERLDGLGYPRGLRGDQIGRLGRILMIVEVALAVFEHGGDQPDLRLSLILRLNHRSSDRELSGLLLGALRRATAQDAAAAGGSEAAATLAALLQDWQRIAASGTGPAEDAARFIDDRVGQVRRLLNDAGYMFDDSDPVIAESPEVAAERSALAHEALWQLRQIAVDAAQRWPASVAPEGEGGAASAGVSQWVGRVSRLGLRNA
jgi:hypothetical protein